MLFFDFGFSILDYGEQVNPFDEIYCPHNNQKSKIQIPNRKSSGGAS